MPVIGDPVFENVEDTCGNWVAKERDPTTKVNRMRAKELQTSGSLQNCRSYSPIRECRDELEQAEGDLQALSRSGM